MSNKPKIYGVCKAGCNWETVHKDDFLKSATAYEIGLTDGEKSDLPLARYKVYADRNETLTTLGAVLPEAKSNVGVATVGSKVYIFGGETGSTADNSILVFDAVTETVMTHETKLPYPVTGIAAAAVGEKIYLFGGRKTGSGVNNHLNAIQVFDTKAGTLTTLSVSLPSACQGIAAVAVGERIYLFGSESGGGSMSANNTLIIFDTETETLANKSGSLHTAAAWIGAAAVGNRIYLFGGGMSTGGSLQNSIAVFDTATETLTVLSETLPTAACGIATAAIEKKIYLLGGYNTTAIYEFDTETGTLTTLSPTVNTAAWYSTAVTVGNRIYIFGGYGMLSSASNKIRVFSVSDCRISFEYNGKKCFISAKGYSLRGWFSFEIVKLEENDSGTETTVIYEIDGNRFYGYANSFTVFEVVDAEDCKLSFSGVNRLFAYNTDATVSGVSVEEYNALLARVEALEAKV